MRILDIYVEQIFQQGRESYALISINDDKMDQYYVSEQVTVEKLAGLGMLPLVGKSSDITVPNAFDVDAWLKE